MVAALVLGIAGLVPSRATAQNRPAGDIPGPIDSVRDLQDTAKMLFKMADTNNDGQISQKEATDVGNLLVGGFFFRADQNGDGVLEPQEAQAAREQLFRQQPLLRYVLQKAKPQNAGNANTNAAPGTAINNQPGQVARNIAANPAQAIGNLLDTNHDRKIEATEVRQAVQQAVQSTVQSGFAAADTNRDGQLSNTEVNAAVSGLARQVAQATFQQADTDNDGQISQAEFEKALAEPVRVAFAVMDLNHDGKLSPQEAQTARQVLASKLRQGYVPEASNSPRNQINEAIGNATQPNQAPAAPAAPR
jgi:Ca2+-binding EF-hand superfamily protein